MEGKDQAGSAEITERPGNWLMIVVDTLANQYGWTKDYILDHVYPDEAVELTGILRRRIYGEYLINLAIVHNPWAKDPKDLWQTFSKEAVKGRELGSEQLDKSGFKRLKTKISRSSRVIKTDTRKTKQ